MVRYGFSARSQGRTAMIAAFATIVFLAALLTLTRIAAVIVEESAAKIRAALSGHSLRAYSVTTAPAPVRFSPRARSQRPVRAQARWRAAA